MLLSLVSGLSSLVSRPSSLVSRLYQEIFTDWRKAIDQNSRHACDDAVPDIWRNIVAAPGGQAACLNAIHDQIDLAGDDVADLLVRMAVDWSSNPRVERELRQHHPTAVAQDTALCALRRHEGWFVGCTSQEFHNAIPYDEHVATTKMPGVEREPRACEFGQRVYRRQRIPDRCYGRRSRQASLGCFDRGYNLKRWAPL
jgi:uncharacterized protein YbdZ (MbtH family)